MSCSRNEKHGYCPDTGLGLARPGMLDGEGPGSRAWQSSLSIFHPAIWRGCVQEPGKDMGNNYNHKIHAGLQKKNHFTACFPHGDPGNLTSRLCRRVGRGRGGGGLWLWKSCCLQGSAARGSWRLAASMRGENQRETPCPWPWGAMGPELTAPCCEHSPAPSRCPPQCGCDAGEPTSVF